MIAPDRDSEESWPIGCRVRVDGDRESWRPLIGRRFAFRDGAPRVTHLWLEGLTSWVPVDRAKRVTRTESCATCSPKGAA